MEPLIHSHVTDVLPDDHPLAEETVYCQGCHEMVHCENNECMTTWVEVPIVRDLGMVSGGNYCLPCFANLKDVNIMMLEWRDEDV